MKYILQTGWPFVFGNADSFIKDDVGSCGTGEGSVEVHVLQVERAVGQQWLVQPG